MGVAFKKAGLKDRQMTYRKMSLFFTEGTTSSPVWQYGHRPFKTCGPHVLQIALVHCCLLQKKPVAPTNSSGRKAISTQSMASFMLMDPKLHVDFIFDRFLLLRNVHVDDNEALSKNEMESLVHFLSYFSYQLGFAQVVSPHNLWVKISTLNLSTWIITRIKIVGHSFNVRYSWY